LQKDSKTSINGEEPWIKNPIPEQDSGKRDSHSESRVSLSGPLFLWALIIIIGIVLEVVVPALLGKHFSSFANSYKVIGSYILTMPGVIILPLVISVWIGHRVGEAAENVKSALRLGLINGIYASIVYGVIIFVTQLILKYTTSYAFTTSFLLKYVILIPIAIVIVFTIVIAALNQLRR
jgi:hypothetical protein